MGKVERCKHGHRWTKENTYWQTKSNGKAYRQCRTCRAEQMRAWQAKQPKKQRKPLGPTCRWGHDRSVYGVRVRAGSRTVPLCRACVHERQYLRQHGLTFKDYERMLKEQSGCCAICLRDTPAPNLFFSVDHCHRTGKVRGLLCSMCNLGLGNFKDNRDSLQNAIDYLTRNTATLTLRKGKS